MVSNRKLLQSADYALNIENNPTKARELAEEVLKSSPSRSERVHGEELLKDIGAAEKQPQAQREDPTGKTVVTGSVTIVDVDISFLNMVFLMVKAAFAAIPAMIIITIFVVFAMMVVGFLVP